MKKALLVLAILLVAGSAHGAAVWQVVLADTAVALSTNCINDTAFGLPDGTVADILWDRNRNGRDDTLGHFEDSLALTCRFPPTCPGTGQDTLNFNSFPLNGESEGLGRGKFYAQQLLRAFGPQAAPQWLPRPDSFYVRVCGDSIYWESDIFSPAAQSTPQVIYLNHWRCVHRPCADVTPAGGPTGFRASDSTFCDGVHLRWDPYPAYGDSIFLYRQDTLIARVSARDTSYIDTAAPPGITLRYAAVARRGSNHRLSPRVFETGYRWPPPPEVSDVSVLRDSLGHIVVCWSCLTRAAVDSFVIFRWDSEIHRVSGGGPGGAFCWVNEENDPERAEYCVGSWNRFCGYSSIDTGTCAVGPPPPARISVQYLPTGGHALGTPCDTAAAIPFADGTPIFVCWDNNANGPDASDRAINTAMFNGSDQGYAAGYFYMLPFYIQQPPSYPDTALYYVKVNSGGTCWTTSDFHVPGPAMVDFTWSQWSCANHPCGPPGVAEHVNATDGNCNITVITWDTVPLATGYRIWRTPEHAPDPALYAATIMAPATQYLYGAGACLERYRFYVTAYNSVGTADSLFEVGYRVYVPDPPASTYATNGFYDDRVHITWPAVSSGCPPAWYAILRDGIVLDSVAATITTYDDSTGVPGIHYAYAVSAINQCGLSAPSPIDSGYRRELGNISEKPPLPTRTALLPCYPNPFNARTTIAFDLAKSEHLRVAIYDLLGREIAVLARGTQNAGSYTVIFDGENLPSGVYICRMEAGALVQQQKLLLLK